MTVIALDLRGVGKSSRPDDPYTIDTFVEDIKDLLEFLDIQEQIHICGISNGGFIVQNFALKHPSLVKTLMLFETGSYVPSNLYELQLKFLESQEFKNLTVEDMIQMSLRGASRSFRRKLKRDEELFKKYIDDMGFLKDPPRYQDYLNHWKAIEGFDVRELLHEITQPTLIILVYQNAKERDDLKEIVATFKKIPNSNFELLEGIGHGFIIEAPEKTNELIWNFLKDHLS